MLLHLDYANNVLVSLQTRHTPPVGIYHVVDKDNSERAHLTPRLNKCFGSSTASQGRHGRDLLDVAETVHDGQRSKVNITAISTISCDRV